MATTRRTRVRKVPLWRWRHNPLKRRSDRVEAWIVLAGWTLALAAGLLAGTAAGTQVQHGLTARRAQVRPVAAVLTRDAPRTPVMTIHGGDPDTVWASLRWTGTDGRAHIGCTRVEPGKAAGARVTVWTDGGRLVTRPATATEARVRTALVAGAAGLGAGGVVLVGVRPACACLDRRRLAEWTAEWERVGPAWRRRTSG